MSLILIYATPVVAAAFNPVGAQDRPAQAAAPADSTLVAARRLANTARLAASEYRLGVVDGKVVLEPEVEEAALFLGEARRVALGLPAPLGPELAGELEVLAGLVGRVGHPDSLGAGVERVVARLAGALGADMDELPSELPSLARGAEIYGAECASCHGNLGRGDGPAAVGLDPVPTKLADAEQLRDASPLDFYRRVTIGVAGTAMPSFEARYSVDDRWAVALYASVLRLPPARGDAPVRLADFPLTARLSDAAIAESLGTDGALDRIAAVRTHAGVTVARDYRQIIATVRARIDSALALAAQGQSDAARSRALDAYLAFEAVERELRVKDPALVASLEQAFADLRVAAVSGEDLAPVRVALDQSLERAERAVVTSLSPVSLFAQSIVILLREGLEAILVVGALMAFLVKLGAGHRRRDLQLGVLAAAGRQPGHGGPDRDRLPASPQHQEALEASTMVVATVMLFWVSYWLLSKIEVARWNRFVKSRLSEALGHGSRFALGSVAFLAVYREGFETVLFYKALLVSGGEGPVGLPVGLGILVGFVVLTAVYVAINRFGVRLPLRPFFAVTSALLYLMAFNFAGTAIAELQEGGFLPLTPVEWLPRVPVLGLYPTMESTLAQALLLALAALALVWTFVVTPRRASRAAA
ncbi:MAG: FTR1 family protein [Gemmatimonadales bacterium]